MKGQYKKLKAKKKQMNRDKRETLASTKSHQEIHLTVAIAT